MSFILRYKSSSLPLKGAISPALQAAISNWAPPDELGKFQSVYMAGGIGLVIDWCVSGFIIEHLGWTYSFYVTAVLLGSFSIVWFSIMYDSPRDHPNISTAEREYILSKLKVTHKQSKVSSNRCQYFLLVFYT